MTRNPAQRKNWRPRYLAGAELKRRREEVPGLTQEGLAERVGSSQKNVAHWENDDYGPGVEIILALARELDCEPTDLMHEAGRVRYGDLLKALNAA